MPYLNLEDVTAGKNSGYFVPMQYRAQLTDIKVRNKELLGRKQGAQSVCGRRFKMDFQS